MLEVLPKDLLSVLRAVALNELAEQQSIGNPSSQIIVDNVPVGKRSINDAKRRVLIRFMDTRLLTKAVADVYNLLQQITRIQAPPKNSIVARRWFYLWVDGVNLGPMPTALSRISSSAGSILNQDSTVRVVGPLVNYGRKLFWNPVGASAKKSFRVVNSKRALGGVRFLPLKGASRTDPRFRAYASRTLRRKANATGAPAEALRAMLSGATPPGRTENAGQIVRRVMRSNAQYRGLYFSDGWVEYPAAAAWSKLGDPRVPSISIAFTKRGATVI